MRSVLPVIKGGLGLALFELCAVLILFFGFVFFAALADYSNQHCWEWPDAEVGNCSDARTISVLAGVICCTALTVVALQLRGYRRG